MLFVRYVKGFTLVELMIAMTVMAILTVAAIPSFSGFTKSQAIIQAFKTLKSDLRVAESRSISGATFNNVAKAWGIRLVNGASQYIIFACNPADPSHTTGYTYGGGQCPLAPLDISTYKTINLPSTITISSPAVDVVFDSQNGSVYANGLAPAANVPITLTDGTTSLTVQISPAGGIIE